jgi:hypothetical protein
MTLGYCEKFLSYSEHCEPKKMLSCVSGKVLCGPLTTVLFTVLKYDVITTRYKWNSMPDYGEIFVNRVLSKAKNLRLIFLSAKRLLASRSSWDAEFVPVPSLISEVEWYAMPLVYSTVFSQKVILKQANLDTLHNHMVYSTVFSQKVVLKQANLDTLHNHMVYFTVLSQNVILKQAHLDTLHTCNHKFLFLFSKVCPNESLPLGSCGPRRCIIGLSIPAYPSGTCIAVVGLYPTQFGNEGRLGTSCSECSADGTKLLTPSTRTNEYDMVPSLKLKYTAEASTNGYGMGPSLEEYRLGASPTLKHRSDGISLSITALLYLMLICLWVVVLNTEPSVASSLLLAHCLAHYRTNQGNRTSFRNSCRRTARRTTNQGQKVPRCCWGFKLNTTSSPKVLLR